MLLPFWTRAKACALGVVLLAAASPVSALVELTPRAGGALPAETLTTVLSPPAVLPAAPLPATTPARPLAVAAGWAADERALECLAQAVYYEARGEAPDGQAAVAQVVLNRARLDPYPSTVCGVVYQGSGSGACQFSFVCNGAMRGRRDLAAWDRARSVAARALGGYVMTAVGAATGFSAVGVRARGRSPGRVRIGGQVFYCARGRLRAPAARSFEGAAPQGAAIPVTYVPRAVEPPPRSAAS